MAFKQDQDQWKTGWLAATGRAGLVLLVLLLLGGLSVLPLFSGSFSAIRPMLMLAAVYYWSLTRPDTLPYPAVFAVGLMLDLIADYPTGLSAMLLIGLRWITVSQRKFLLGQTFPAIWAAFAFLALVAALLQWLVFMAFNAATMSAQPALMSALLTAALFPLTVPFLALVNKMLAESHEP